MNPMQSPAGEQVPQAGARSGVTPKRKRRLKNKSTLWQALWKRPTEPAPATTTTNAANAADYDNTATKSEPRSAASPREHRTADSGKKRAKAKGQEAKPSGQVRTAKNDAVEQAESEYSGWILDLDEGSRTPPPLFDGAEVRRALRLLLPPGQVTEVRALEAKFRGDRSWPAVLSGYFDDPGKLIAALATIESAKGIYIILNSVNPALLARAANRIKRVGKGDVTGDGDIVARRWLMVDCDPVRPPGISSTGAEHQAALDRAVDVERYLRGKGWVEPIVADSGNGGHLLYPIDQPANDGSMVERCLKALDARFTDRVVKIDAEVFNPARIWKLYGTAACKGDHIAQRPHRLSRILSAPGEN